MYILIYINEYIKIVLYPVAEYLSWYWQTLWQEIEYADINQSVDEMYKNNRQKHPLNCWQTRIFLLGPE